MGTIAKKMAPVVRSRFIFQMAEPRWVMAVSAARRAVVFFDTYSVLQGIDRIIPVDVYVPGCPPRPEQIIDGLMQIQYLAQNEKLRRRNTDEYQELLASYNIQ